MEKEKNNLSQDANFKNTNLLSDHLKKEKKQKKKFPKWLLLIFVIILVGGGSFIYARFQLIPKQQIPNQEDKDNSQTKEDSITPGTKVAFAQKFAEYNELPVNINPQISDYSTDETLSNIANKDDFSFLSENARKMLAKNNFVVLPSYSDEFFPIYESNRYSLNPSFITTDSIFHNYHLAFDYLLRDLEKSKLSPELSKLVNKMFQASQEQYGELKDSDWENAAKRNVGFFATVASLLNSEIVAPEYIKEEVIRELELINAHQKVEDSPVMNVGRDPETTTYMGSPQGVLSLEGLKEDYTQYIARGHYTKSEELKAYFKAMMYLGRMTFRLKEVDETKSAILFTLALNKDQSSYSSWEKIYEPTVFFVGKTDDISIYDYQDLVEKIYGTAQPELSLLAENEDKLIDFLEEANQLSPPKINSMPIWAAYIQSDREKEIKGFRFMGQRFTVDASIFQRLLYREVGDKIKPCKENGMPEDFPDCLGGARCLPKGLDIPAAMGSDEAERILREQGEFDYACYPENMAKIREYVAGLDKNTWTQNLYWGWLYSLKSLLQARGEGWPSFMTNNAWIRKDLTTYLSSWTELKHDTILYAKQAYAELGGGPVKDKDDRGYVEPNVYAYARLAALLQMTKEGLQVRNLLSEKNAEFLDKMYILVKRLKEISERELNNEPLTDDDYNLIRTYGGSLEHFWIEAFKDRGVTHSSQLSEEPAPIIADVATDPNGVVLEEGTGYIAKIYAIVPIDSQLKIAVGGVYTHYEFPWDMSDRLTDEKWRKMIEHGSESKPEIDEWTNVYLIDNDK
jgi:hypothetical protein